MIVAAFSDCHWQYEKIKEFPKADMCIFAGDSCGSGYNAYEVYSFFDWFKKLPYENKIVIPGNHDRHIYRFTKLVKDIYNKDGIKLLIDEKININGVSIYGTPWCPRFGNWAYMADEEELKNIFSLIPNNIDILITHTPPKNVLDSDFGSSALLEEIKIKKPKHHIFGHIHENYGSVKKYDTKFYNVSICDEDYEPVNKITTFEI